MLNKKPGLPEYAAVPTGCGRALQPMSQEWLTVTVTVMVTVTVTVTDNLLRYSGFGEEEIFPCPPVRVP
jgi:hypothetical protein